MTFDFSVTRTLSMAKKEVRHILQDPFTLAVALGFPLLLLTFFGYVIDFNVKNIRLLAVDSDHSRASRQLMEVFESSQYFKLTAAPSSGQIVHLLDEEKAKAVLMIEPGFGKDWARNRTAKAQVILDGADNSIAGTILTYLSGIQAAALKKLSGEEFRQTITLKTRFLYNPELNSQWFVIPGLTVVIIGIISILLTALTVAREWENGSMELLLSTPVRPLEIIIGKLAPYILIGLGAVVTVYLAARGLFQVPFKGNHLLYLVACALFLGTTLAQGLVISVVARQQALAIQLANITGMLPSLLLSGFIFPIESMPRFFQIFTSILPAKWFMVIIRGIFLKGAGLLDLKTPFIALFIINVVLIFIAAKSFKKDLEP